LLIFPLIVFQSVSGLPDSKGSAWRKESDSSPDNSLTTDNSLTSDKSSSFGDKSQSSAEVTKQVTISEPHPIESSGTFSFTNYHNEPNPSTIFNASFEPIRVRVDYATKEEYFEDSENITSPSKTPTPKEASSRRSSYHSSKIESGKYFEYFYTVRNSNQKSVIGKGVRRQPGFGNCH
jgi:hypothetical protein